jgi:hypothetical protein
MFKEQGQPLEAFSGSYRAASEEVLEPTVNLDVIEQMPLL